jgi:hypothetical protein
VSYGSDFQFMGCAGRSDGKSDFAPSATMIRFSLIEWQ